MAHNKRINSAKSLIQPDVMIALEDGLSKLIEYRDKHKAKYDETVEVVLNLGVDPRHSDQLVRGMVAMPHGLGKVVRIAVITRPERVEEARKAGADLVGSDELIDEIKAGKIDFDVCIATPDYMPKMAALGKVLGPKGLMPNPKLGTVSDDIVTAVKNAKFGQVEYKVEKAGIVHAGIGKISFSIEALKGNIMALYNAVLAAKPSGAKGVYMKKMYLTTSHGPSVPIDLKSIMV
jgi:large subunit ribosomal protein L1